MRIATTFLLTLNLAGVAIAQAPTATAPAANTPAASQPASIDESFSATIVKVVGNVSYAPAGPDGKPGEFKPAKVGDKLPAGTMIKTALRSKVMLTFGPDSVVLIDRVTLASIDQFHRSGDTKKVQLGLGHGLIRAATAETTLRSEMTISSPVATLSKRGTIDFGMRYEAGTGRYVIWLNQDGLVEALDLLRNERRFVEPGQYVTQALLKWIETITLDRYVPVTDNWGLTGSEQAWNAKFGGSGAGVADPAGGSGIYSSSFSPSSSSQGRTGGSTNRYVPSIISSDGSPFSVHRPEGNFGTGFGQ